MRAVLGNDIAIQAYREEKQSFPDGTLIARLAWAYTPSEDNNKVFGQQQSFVAGAPKEGVQFMVTGFGKIRRHGRLGVRPIQRRQAGRRGDDQDICFPCHAPAQAHDFVFTRYAP
ncbi:MAG: cytochrome P460 family protein [Alphaproteobacteria bacterium]|nr:cytochrome P460 family protein [Alphaproteobacteria bacterium]